MDIHQYWAACLTQNAQVMRHYFQPDATIYWHNTNERFTVDEFIRANCEYPGTWQGHVKQVIEANGTVVAAVHVCSPDLMLSAHVVSIITLENNTIVRLDEYWGDDGEAPGWRQAMGIGTPIK